ncbi:MAG: TIGR02449 family protein [Gammaproteobacteria bacterium]
MTIIIEKLEQRVCDLIKLIGSIRRENDTLRAEQRLLRRECDALREKNRIASGRVEQIVSRLEAMQA